MRRSNLARLAVLVAAAAAATASSSGHHHDHETLPMPASAGPTPRLTGHAQRIDLDSPDSSGFVAVGYRVRNGTGSRLFLGHDNVTASFGLHTAEPLAPADVKRMLDQDASLSDSDRRVLELRLTRGVPDSIAPHRSAAGVLVFAVPDDVRDDAAMLHVFWLDGLTRDGGFAAIPIADFAESPAEEDVSDEVDADEEDADGEPETAEAPSSSRRWGAAIGFGLSKLARNDDLVADRTAGYALAFDATISLTDWLHSEIGLTINGASTAASAGAPMELADYGDLDVQTVGFWSGLRAQSTDGDMHPFASIGTAFVNTTLRADGDHISDDSSSGLGVRVGLDIDLSDRIAIEMSYSYVALAPVNLGAANDIDVSRSTFLFGLRAATKGDASE